MTRRIELPFRVKKPILALGADLKGAFAIAKGGTAVLVDGFGDLSDPDNFTSYERAIKSELKRCKIRPEIVACDLHPGYFSARFAENYTLFKVQHHEAHVASAIVDRSIRSRVIGVAFDGTGYGSDGNIWGAEFFTGDLRRLKRVAHFEYVPMPGGDAVVREPWRMAASYLYKAFDKPKRLPFLTSKVKMVSKWPILKKMIDKNINSPLTSSAGRLFDAVGSLVLSRPKAGYEAELPIELEQLAGKCREGHYDFDIKSKGEISVIENSKLIKGIVRDLLKKADRSVISAKFHNTMTLVILKAAIILRKRMGINKVVLTGGVFQNKYLRERSRSLLEEADFDVYTHSYIPTNDSGIPIGQVAIASVRDVCV